MANPKHPFGLGKDQRRKEKKGGAAGLPGAAAGSTPSGLAFDSGVEALSTLGRAAPTGGSQVGLWEGLVGGLSKATGLGAVAAGKTLVVGLVVAASSLAAGVSLYIGNSTPTSAPSLGRRVFVDSASEEEPVKLARVSAPAETQTQSGSLEYVAEGNAPAAEAAAAPEKTSDAPAATPEVKNSELPNHDAPAPATAVVHDPGPKPQLAKRAMPQARGEPGGGARLEPLKSLNGKMGAGFQEVYRPTKTGAFDATSQAKSGYGVNRRSVLAKSGTNAMAQAKFANRMSQSGTRMGNGTSAAHTTSLPFDGANTAAALGATKAGGSSIGGTGVASSANGILDSKSVEPPPAPESKKNENKTPYQGLIMAAIAALMIGTVLLMIAGKMAGEAKKCTGPDCAAKLQAAKMLAAAAMAAGGAAAAMGGVLAGQYGQMTQGMPFIMGGGILAVQAGMVLMKDDKAGEDGAEGVSNAAGQAASQAGQALSGMNNQGSDKGSSNSNSSKPATVNVVKPNAPTYHGNINTP
ncbi:hypothetical protein EPO15_13790 [bacterium]|nr:MAG: hypothetical protein EPO15_13790 [bacterium]